MKVAIFETSTGAGVFQGVFEAQDCKEAICRLYEDVWFTHILDRSLEAGGEMLRMVGADDKQAIAVFTAHEVVSILRAAGRDILPEEEEAHTVFYEDCTIPDDLDD